MIYVVHIVKEIKLLNCNWMDYVSLKKENGQFGLFLKIEFGQYFTQKDSVSVFYMSIINP